MDEKLARQIQDAVRSGDKDVKTELVEAIVDLGGNSLTVRHARDTLSAVLGKARKGKAQLIGRKREEMIVVMSLQDLVDIIFMAAKPPSLGDALDAIGFKPVSRKVTVGQGHPRQTLTRPSAWTDSNS